MELKMNVYNWITERRVMCVIGKYKSQGLE